MRVSRSTLDLESLASGMEPGLSVEVGRVWGERWAISLHGRLAVASGGGDDVLPLVEHNGVLVEVYDAVEWLPMLGVQSGVGYMVTLGETKVMLGVEVGIARVTLYSASKRVHLAPFGEGVVEVRLGRVGLFGRAGRFGAPVSWEDDGEQVRSFYRSTPMWDVGVSLRF